MAKTQQNIKNLGIKDPRELAASLTDSWMPVNNTVAPLPNKNAGVDAMNLLNVSGFPVLAGMGKQQIQLPALNQSATNQGAITQNQPNKTLSINATASDMAMPALGDNSALNRNYIQDSYVPYQVAGTEISRGISKEGNPSFTNMNPSEVGKKGLSILPSLQTNDNPVNPAFPENRVQALPALATKQPISDQQLQSLIGLATQEVNAGEVGKRNAQEGAQRVLSELLGYNTSTRGQDLNAQESTNALNQRAKEQGYQNSMQQLQAMLQGGDNQAMRANQLYDLQTQRVKALQEGLPKLPEYSFQTVANENGGQQLFAINKSNPSDFQQVGAKGQAAEDAIFFEKANAMLARAEQNPQLKNEPEFQAMMQERARRIAQNKSK